MRNNTVLANDNSGKSDAVRVFSTIQRDYATKLEQVFSAFEHKAFQQICTLYVIFVS